MIKIILLFLLLIFSCMLPAQTNQNLKELSLKTIITPENCKNIKKFSIQKPKDILDKKNPITLLLISKSLRKLFVISNDTVLFSFHTAFGSKYANGPKAQEGDMKTPEGTYNLEMKNPQSNFYKALRINYPLKSDLIFAQKNNVSAGGDIMIHGISNEIGELGFSKAVASVINYNNWTQGCIAIRNDEMDLFFNEIQTNTKIEICPIQ